MPDCEGGPVWEEGGRDWGGIGLETRIGEGPGGGNLCGFGVTHGVVGRWDMQLLWYCYTDGK